jgi:hypothetical protein
MGTFVSGVAPAQAAQTLDQGPKPSPVSALGDEVVWSSYRSELGAWVLMHRVSDTTTQVPVAPRTVPFDADLGRAPNGSTNVSYSRCQQEPASTDGVTQLPRYEAGKRCRVYSFDFATGAETRVDRLGSASASEFLPAAWRHKLLFASVPGTGPNRAIPKWYLASEYDSRHPALRVVGRGSVGRPGSLGHGEFQFPPKPVAGDLVGNAAAFSWFVWSPPGCHRAASQGEYVPPSATEIWLARLPDRPQRVARACLATSSRRLVSPSIADRLLRFGSWAASDGNGHSMAVVEQARLEAPTDQTPLVAMPLQSTSLVSLAVGDSATYAALSDGTIIDFPRAK